MTGHWLAPRIVLILATMVFASGCASVQFVKEQLGLMDEKIAQETATRQQQVDAVHVRMTEMESTFSQKFADRNKYVVRETRTFLFDFNKASLKDAAITSLTELGRLLKEDPNTLVELQGHADAVGPDLLPNRYSVKPGGSAAGGSGVASVKADGDASRPRREE
ncbi:MAG: hypothetical protein IH782_08120 [candidate division NC10 bacterium]|nr:hypothetical protein [candidate division NC10 bacterium]